MELALLISGIVLLLSLILGGRSWGGRPGIRAQGALVIALFIVVAMLVAVALDSGAETVLQAVGILALVAFVWWRYMRRTR